MGIIDGDITLNTTLNGSPSETAQIDGDFGGEMLIDGSVGLQSTVIGEMVLDNALNGEFGTYIAVEAAPRPHYLGPTEITPTNYTQTISTTGMVLDEDIIVNPIPSNYGLITWNGSVLRVS